MIATLYDVEAAAEKYGLKLSSFGDLTGSRRKNPDKFLAYAYFTNKHDRNRKKHKEILIRYYMERTEPGVDSFRATTLYDLEVQGLKTNDKKPYGGIFEGITK